MNYFKTPEKKHIHVYYRIGRFNLLSSEETARYSFVFPELSKEEIEELGISRTSFSVDLDKDYQWDGKPLDTAYELQALFDSYWMSSYKEPLNKLIKYLESIEEKQEQLRKQYDVDYAKAKVEYWRERLEGAEKISSL